MIKLLGNFLRLIRWPNLVFVAITQGLFHFFVALPSMGQSKAHFPLSSEPHVFILLCLASVLISAAGYIINDYFDINIDLVNKPHKMIVDKFISRRWALLWHLILSAAGIIIGIYISVKLNNFIIAISNVVCVLLLWFYSTTYKRRLLIGNILISALTAWVVLVVVVAEVPWLWQEGLHNDVIKTIAARISRLGLLYGAFAFIISIIREVIKDLEDLEGDRKEGCKTMPIVWGVNASKIFSTVWLVVLMVSLIIIQVYTMAFGTWLGWLSAIFILATVVYPLLQIAKKLYAASKTPEYSSMSRQLKFIMLAGIVSMIFFHWLN